jgi:hypothetical protein
LDALGWLDGTAAAGRRHDELLVAAVVLITGATAWRRRRIWQRLARARGAARLAIGAMVVALVAQASTQTDAPGAVVVAFGWAGLGATALSLRSRRSLHLALSRLAVFVAGLFIVIASLATVGNQGTPAWPLASQPTLTALGALLVSLPALCLDDRMKAPLRYGALVVAVAAAFLARSEAAVLVLVAYWLAWVARIARGGPAIEPRRFLLSAFVLVCGLPFTTGVMARFYGDDAQPFATPVAESWLSGAGWLDAAPSGLVTGAAVAPLADASGLVRLAAERRVWIAAALVIALLIVHGAAVLRLGRVPESAGAAPEVIDALTLFAASVLFLTDGGELLASPAAVALWVLAARVATSGRGSGTAPRLNAAAERRSAPC